MSTPGAGFEYPAQEVSWVKRDILLFAHSIGCKADELHFLYELHPNFAVFPTYSLILPFKHTDQDVINFYARSQAIPIPGVPNFDSSRAVDGQRKLTVLKPLPPTSEGKKIELRNKVIGVYDKGKAGTVIESEQTIVDKESGEIYTKTVSSNFMVGQGNWGGPKGPSTVNYPPPDRKPDAVHVIQSTAETPLLYRLNGDYNPLHATPEPGQKMGFGGVIIHGLFSWNSAAHGILRELGGSDPQNLKEFQARFASPVLPGDKLTTEIWRTGNVQDGLEEIRFVTSNNRGKVVLSNGRCLLKAPTRGIQPLPTISVRSRNTTAGPKKYTHQKDDVLPPSIRNAAKRSPFSKSYDTADFAPPIQIKVSAREYDQFGQFWLRDNCQCSECVHPDTRQRTADTFKIPEDIHATKVFYDKKKIQIHWSDGHVGGFDQEWLNIHKPTYIRFHRTKVSPQDIRPAVSYDYVMSGTQGLYEWLEMIYIYGFCFVEGVPINPESTKTLLERIAFIRHTHYGGFWDFTADLTFKDTAYTNEFLGAHTDNTYFTDPSRLQLFHLLSHEGKGGENLLVDGFQAARQMFHENEENFMTLSNIPQPFHSSGNEDFCIQPAEQMPVFNIHSRREKMYQIRWNNYDRAAKSDWPIEDQNRWYYAARHFDHVLKRREYHLKTQLKPGTALIFDNWRMLHGRTAFTGKRRMCGGYINSDDFLSRLRLLKHGRENVLKHIGDEIFSRANPGIFF
ncbi:hypothetical protein BDV25DRAFT_127328 [Aspergillus avenaceus]|uniref:Trimethyllysine dioxygenase n=1 Tax=Aspergillus avenaceus TaxID=36643 RepID=A0A5N6U413_ASPAV|nr:hypothetical protein BDV25DRAFT_127328 [Aspergillus avenaceus]